MNLPAPSRSRIDLFFSRPGGRLLGLTALILVLMIPLGMINEQVRERGQRRDVAAADIAQSWGGAQILSGPLLRLTYSVDGTEENEGKVHKRRRRGTFMLTPKKLAVNAVLDAEIRRRGIFEMPVYAAELQMRGHFQMPDAASLPKELTDMRIDRAELVIGVSHPGSIGADSRVVIGQQELVLEPSGFSLGAQGVHGLLRNGLSLAQLEKPMPFSLEMNLKGATAFDIAPLASETRLQVDSGWPHPGFHGGNLPMHRQVSEQGFSASWSVSNLGNGAPPMWLGNEISTEKLHSGAFGVSLVVPVDPYTMAARVTKYGALLLVLSFALIWVMELLGGKPLHPIQYLLLGAALCLFGLLQLALAEHLGFTVAFIIAVAAVVVQASWYARVATANSARASVLGALLSTWFAYLYVVLQAEDFAFLLGAMALFAALTGVMWATRNVNWASGSRWDVADAVIE